MEADAAVDRQAVGDEAGDSCAGARTSPTGCAGTSSAWSSASASRSSSCSPRSPAAATSCSRTCRARRRRCSRARSRQRSTARSRSRIQCTPDLQPTDVTGLSVYDQRSREFEFRPGPVFANVLLVDEINRAMPKTQSALLEAMAEGQVTVDGVTRPLPDPFLVLATENPIEQEGTFPLPEAQLDRFFLRTALGYPSADEELGIVDATARRPPARRSSRRSSRPTTCSSSGARVEDVYIDELAAALDRRARARDAGARVRRARRLGPRQPRARAGGPRLGAHRRPRLRRARGRRDACSGRSSSTAS